MTKANDLEGAQCQGKKWVSRHYGGNDIDTDEKLEIQTFDVEPAWIKVGCGVTINLGNFESARCDVGVTLPTYVEELSDAFKRAWGIAEEEIQRQVKEIKGN